MKRIQKRAHGRVDALANINGGLHALRQALRARLPEDFDCWFIDSGSEVVAGYECNATGYRNELRAENVSKLLVRWQAIDWDAERRVMVPLELQRSA